MKPRWEHFEDAPRTGVRGFGATPAEAFEQVGLAFTATLADPGRVGTWETLELRCEAPDLERLLATWLRLLAAEAAARQLLFSRFQIRIDEGRLAARAWGEQMDLRHRRLPRLAEGAPLHVARHADGWLALASLEAERAGSGAKPAAAAAGPRKAIP